MGSTIEKQIDFYYCAKKLKTLNFKFDFEVLDTYTIDSRITGESVGSFETLAEVWAFIAGIEQGKIESSTIT